MHPVRFDIITLFPQTFPPYFNEGMIRKGVEQELLTIHYHNPRDYSKNKWRKVDDIPYGGGAGMVMTPQPLFDTITAVKKLNKGPVIYMSPKGKIITHTQVKRMAGEICEKAEKSKKEGLILVCGRYEGIDQRVIDLLIDQELSIGKYVLTGGELAAMVVIDAISRFIPDVLGDPMSPEEDSFSRKLSGKKEYPHYTKPRTFKGLSVPDVLLSGNHANINKWRKNNLS